MDVFPFSKGNTKQVPKCILLSTQQPRALGVPIFAERICDFLLRWLAVNWNQMGSYIPGLSLVFFLIQLLELVLVSSQDTFILVIVVRCCGDGGACVVVFVVAAMVIPRWNHFSIHGLSE